MSETDSFIEEVTEEVRRDRLFALFRKYGWIGITAVVLIVGGAAFKEWRAAQDRAAARAFGDAVLTAQALDGAAAQAKALSALKATGTRGAIADLLAASADGKAGDTKAEIAKLDAIAADTALPAAYRDLAQLKKVTIAGDAISAEDRARILGALSQPGRIYRPLALEQLALDAVKAGKTQDAIKQFNAILQDASTTAGLRQRAQQMIVALGGKPEAS